MAKNEFKYEVVEYVSTLSEREYDKTDWKSPNKEKVHHSETKEVRKIKWNDSEEIKYDIRIWDHIDGKEICGKGISLSQEEWDALQFAGVTLDAEEQTA